MKLSDRLNRIIEFIPPSRCVADIGTDHALLPIAVIRKNIAPRAIAMDINRGPLETAERNVGREGLSDKISCRLSDGLESLEPGEADTAVIAGMGGELITGILKRGIEDGRIADGMRFVLSPHTHGEILRRFLLGAGFRISGEDMLKDQGKYYNVILCQYVPSAVKEAYEPEEIYFGKLLIQGKNRVLKEYLEKELTKFSSLEQKKDYLKLVKTALNMLNSYIAE